MITGSIAYNRWVAQNTGSTSPGWIATVEGQNIKVRQNIASLRVERENVGLSNALLIPGLQTPLSELRSLLFGQGQQGGIWMPSLSPAMIAGNTFGSGVQTFLDLSGRGNNATQATSGNRPAWGRVPKTGRRNLLTWTEDFTNVVWSKPSGGINTSIGTSGIEPNVSAAPDTSITADRVNFINQSDSDLGLRKTIPAIGGQTYTASIWVKGESTNIGKQVRLRLKRGTTGTGSFITQSFTLTGDWVRVNVSLTLAADNVDIQVILSSNTGEATSALIWGAQLELGSTPTPYQRVTTAFDITEAGQRDCYYVQPDGVNQSMATGSINFTGTPRVTVFAGVRKLSDAAQGALVELTNSSINNGMFGIYAPGSAAANYQFRSKGTTDVNSTISGYSAPITNILTMVGDIASPLLQARINGVQVINSTGSQGTGTFSNDVLYFFRRGGTTIPFNGQCFGLIVAGGSYSLSTIQRVERILSRYTPTVNL